ncbi:unnamed protein product [Prunus brigantina]
MKCVDDIKTFQATFMADLVYDILAGLDYTYDKITMLGSGTKIGEPAVVFASKNTALVFRHTVSDSSIVPPCHLTSAEKEKLKCDHCGEKRHIIDTCWALHGVPDWEK